MLKNGPVIIIHLLIILSLYCFPGILKAQDPLEDLEIETIDVNSSSEQDRLPIRFMGYVESRNRFRAYPFGERLSLRQRIWLESSAGNGSLKGFVNGYCDDDPAIADRSEEGREVYDVGLNEGYVTIDTDRLDLMIGQKMVRWGATDGVSTMDIINPLDTTDPIGNARTDARLPIPLVQAIFTLPGVIVDTVLIPKPQVNGLPPSGSPWEPDDLKELREADRKGLIDLTRASDPGNWFESPEYGCKVSTVCKGFDLALLYFTGFFDNPVFHRFFMPDGTIMVEPRYERIQAFGFNFAKGLEKGTIRGELAYKPALRYNLSERSSGYPADEDGLVERDLYQAVLGFDYTFLTTLYVNLQVFADLIEDGPDPLMENLSTHGFTFKVHENFLDDDLEAGVRGIRFTSENGWSIELYGEYMIGDKILLSPALTVFGGEEGTSMGQYNKNDMISVRVRYFF